MKHKTFCLFLLLFALPLVSRVAQAQAFAYVANAGSTLVSVIDTATNTALGTVGVGPTPNGWPSRPMGPLPM